MNQRHKGNSEFRQTLRKAEKQTTFTHDKIRPARLLDWNVAQDTGMRDNANTNNQVRQNKVAP